jgi:hypothetical protein
MGLCASKPATRDGGSRHDATQKRALDSSIRTGAGTSASSREGPRASPGADRLHVHIHDSFPDGNYKLQNTSSPGAFDVLNSSNVPAHLFPQHELTRSSDERHLESRLVNLHSAAQAHR